MNPHSIEQLTHAYALAQAELTRQVEQLQIDIEDLKRRRMQAIKKAQIETSMKKGQLAAAIERNPQLFEGPRTAVYHGIKVGLHKGKGTINFDDSARVIRLIRKHLPKQAKKLIRVEERPLKNALAELSAADLKRIGCSVSDSNDQIVIKHIDTEQDINDAIHALFADIDAEERLAKIREQNASPRTVVPAPALGMQAL